MKHRGPVTLSLAGVVLLLWLGRSLFSAASVESVFPLRGLEAGRLYAVTVSVESAYRLAGELEIEASISDARGIVAGKTLHVGDLDFYITLRPRAAGAGTVRLNRRPGAKNVPVSVECVPIELSGDSNAVIAALPNSTWQEAQEFSLGQTIFGANDERAFIPAPSEDAVQALRKGFQWFRFTFKGMEPRLVYFTLDVADREVPVDLEIFQVRADPATGREDTVLSAEGQFAYRPEATQNFPGLYKFRTRVLSPGQTYYVRVAANHPVYQLRTSEYPVPPYEDPRLAVRAGMDFLVSLGDSWHANTPRRGSTALRNTMAHAETQLCVACHPTQFTTRGYLTAVENGYPVGQRSQLKFLMDRMYNNPRPLYGQEDTQWVRVIYSARTVASRIPLLLSMFEKLVSREAPRPGLDRGFANYLKIHYEGLQELPGEEPDGCSPNVSPFEIAAQSWQVFDLLFGKTGDSTWGDSRDHVEDLTVRAPVRTVIDLNWKITALSQMDRGKHAEEIEKLVRQLYGLQREDGMWSYRFEPDGQPSEFITYHALYALATAGRRPENDPGMAKALDLCLHGQRPDGSWQGDPVYKGFDTPFRDTQFAVMALSHLFPGPGGAGWEGGSAPAPADLHPESLDRFLEETDRLWDLPPESVLRTLRSVAVESRQPLARHAALSALGRVADPRGIEAAVASLGAPTKVVQLAAAWSLREIATRRATGRKELSSALSAASDRTRWGATRVFNQHFRDLTGDTPLLESLIRNLDDPIPSVRYHAAAGLWRWSYWQADHGARRGRILEALCARMGREEHRAVRRGLMESIYNVLDENTGYLRAWVKSAAAPEDQRRISEGYEEVARQQSRILARALRQGNSRAREGILISLWDFHTRHMALPDNPSFQINLPAVFSEYVTGVPDLHRAGYDYTPYREAANFAYDVSNAFQQTRIGNDSELIHFFASSGADLENALLECLEGADSRMKINVLKAGHTLSEAGGAVFARAVLHLSLDPDPKVREAVRYVYERGGRGVINIEGSGAGAGGVSAPVPGELADAVTSVLRGGSEEGLAVVLPLLADLEPESPWRNVPAVTEALKRLVEIRAGRPLHAEALLAAASFPELLRDAPIRQRIREGLSDRSVGVRRASLQILLYRYGEQSDFAPMVEESLAGLDSGLRGILLSELSVPRKPRYKGRAASATGLDVAFLKLDDIKQGRDLLADPAIVRAVAGSLRDRDANIRAAALDLVARRKELLRRPEISAAVEELRSDPTRRVARLSDALARGVDPRTTFAELDSSTLLDFDFFTEKVQPILAKRGADGMACVMCHESHAILKLQPPDYNDRFSETRSRENFRYALGVVNVAEPEKSLLLIKPTRPSDSAGDVRDYLATHNGGQRWPENEQSEEYQTILQWIRGARRSPAPVNR